MEINIYDEKRTVYKASEFPFDKLKESLELKNKSIRSKTWYYDSINTFDTETTTYREGGKDLGFMYIWGFSLNGFLVYGNYGKELGDFLYRLKAEIDIDEHKRFIIYCHNYAFDWQFTNQFITRRLGFPKIFATDPRRILKCDWEGIEFRCSYKLTNMSLDKFTKFELGCTKLKMTGDLDYSVFRLPASFNYNEKEWKYFLGDLISLADGIECKLKNEGDNLLTVPLTSTGYIRNYTRAECFADIEYKRWFRKLSMTEKVYTMTKHELRGGDTHENRFYQNVLMEEKSLSFDYKSCYPYAIVMFGGFPVSPFVNYGMPDTLEEFEALLRRRCCLFYVTFEEIRIKKYNPISCISVSKILTKESIDIVDNGRLIEGRKITLCCNELDWQDINDNYDFTKFTIRDLHIAKKGYLPKAYRDCVFNLFLEKCKLEEKKKLDPEYEYMYAKFKNKLNATYGCFLTDICHNEITFNYETLEWESEAKDIQEQLDKYFKNYNSFLFYPQGAYVTSFCRLRLHRLIRCCNKPYYWDTDSCKGSDWNMEALEALNAETIKGLEDEGYVATVNGKNYYLGIAEMDCSMIRFKGMGAKKYAYETEDHELHTTIAGVNKKKGAIELKEKGGLEAFNDGFKFIEAGSICAKYNDEPIHKVSIAGEEFEVASNIALVPTSYTLSRPDDYLKRANFTIYERID